MSIGYSEVMRDAPAYVSVSIDVQEPIELVEFVGIFTSLANQFDKFIRASHPELEGDARIYIKEVRKGSIEADLIPWALAIIGNMDRILIVEDFVRRYGSRLSPYFEIGGRDPEATKSDLRDLTQAVVAIANDPAGTSRISTVAIERDGVKTKAVIQFDTVQARTALRELDAHRRELERKEAADHENVLMTFFQSNLKDSAKSGEQVLIESVHPKPLPIIYCSELARQRVKGEMLHGDRNIYRLGFLVDVNLETLCGRPVAYRLINVRDVIDLPPD
jgi:hypothetical protein